MRWAYLTDQTREEERERPRHEKMTIREIGDQRPEEK
jgi:hypothetical protein